MGKVATYPLLPRGSVALQSGRQVQEWPTSGQGGYITPAAKGVPTALGRGYVATLPTCGPLLNLPPALKHGDPP